MFNIIASFVISNNTASLKLAVHFYPNKKKRPSAAMLSRILVVVSYSKFLKNLFILSCVFLFIINRQIHHMRDIQA